MHRWRDLKQHVLTAFNRKFDRSNHRPDRPDFAFNQAKLLNENCHFSGRGLQEFSPQLKRGGARVKKASSLRICQTCKRESRSVVDNCSPWVALYPSNDCKGRICVYFLPGP